MFIAGIAQALNLPDFEMHYEKRTGKVLGIVNKTASRESNAIKVLSRSVIDPKEKESIAIQAADKFLLEKGNLLGVKNVSSDLYPKGVTEDRIGAKVIRYEQRYSGVPVYGSEIVSVLNTNNEVISSSGRLLEDLSININSKVSAKSAIRYAKKDMEKRYSHREKKCQKSLPL